MHRRDGRLCLNRARRARFERPVEQRGGTSDCTLVPARPVLVREGNGTAVLVESSVSSSVVEQQEGEQTAGLGLPGIRLDDGAREPDGEAAQICADRRTT